MILPSQVQWTATPTKSEHMVEAMVEGEWRASWRPRRYVIDFVDMGRGPNCALDVRGIWR